MSECNTNLQDDDIENESINGDEREELFDDANLIDDNEVNPLFFFSFLDFNRFLLPI